VFYHAYGFVNVLVTYGF